MSNSSAVAERPAEVRPLPAAIAEGKRLLMSDPAAAESRAREILATSPDDREAKLLLGEAVRMQGDAAQARDILEPLALADGDWKEVRLELARALSTLGENRAAIAVLMEAVGIDRNYSQAWSLLGEQYILVGDILASDAAYSHHFNISVNEPALQKAVAALRNGRPDITEDILTEFLERNPEHVNAIKMLAEAAIACDRNEDASALLEQCLELAPDFAAARYRLVSSYYLQNRIQEAMPHIDMLLERDPLNPQFRTMKASLLGQMGRDLEALDLFEGLVREYPMHPSSWVSYGHALKSAGKQNEGVTAYRRAIELLPELGGGYWSLANLKTFRFTERDIEAMQGQLERSDLRVEARVQFYFSLGKAYEDLKQFEKSFENYQLGNALWRSTIEYDADKTHGYVEVAKEILTPDFFKQLKGVGCYARDPIFVIGLPRAGSTLLEQILSSHSQIEGTMELPNITSLARHLNEDNAESENPGYPELLGYLDPAEFERRGEEYIRDTRRHRILGKPYFVDKMPNNYAHVPLIHLILPNAKIIDARRHPMGSCFSNFKQHFARGQHFTYSLTDVGRFYRDYVELMAHYDAILPGRVHRVIYEEMVENPEREIRRVLEYIGVPFEEQCLRFHETERAVRTASSEQVRTPLYKTGVDHWRNFEPWLGPLKAALGPVLEEYPNVPKFA
ncbi:MAG TPA: sulfotransferase [Rhizomicrobium sp.]|nr:sulfotransferase [Rhizomicrobium sp.]